MHFETGTALAADIILTVLERDVNPSVFIPALFPPVAACSSRGPLRHLRFHPPSRSILPLRLPPPAKAPPAENRRGLRSYSVTR